MTLRIADIGDRRANREPVDSALEDAVGVVAATRPHLVDAWEAATVAESLGYTPDRVRRELGFADTRAFGEFLFEQLANRPVPAVAEEMSPALAPGAPAAARAWAFSCLTYAALWSVAYALERSASTVTSAHSATLSLMTGLIVTAGIAFAIQQRGGFYLAVAQPALAKLTGAYMWRVGALMTLAVAAGSVAMGWVTGLASWRQLVLWADGFVLSSIAVLTIALATVASPWAAGRKPRQAQAAFPLPRLTVVLSRTIPRAATVSAGFVLMFSERLYASASGWAGSLLALDAAVLAMLLGMASVESVAVAFSRHISRATSEPAGPAAAAIARAGRSSHTMALLWSGAGYAGACITVAAAALMGWFAVPLGVLGLALACGLPLMLALMNARLLITLRAPSMAVASLAAGVVVAIITATTSAHFVLPAGTSTGAGAMVAFATSMFAVRRALHHCDRALLVA